MKRLKTSTGYWIASVAGAALLIFLVVRLTDRNSGRGRSQPVRRGNLETVVSSRGEINGENSEKIELSEILRDDNLRVWQYKLVDLVQEGKYVKKGDFIARLDRTELENNLRQRTTELETVQAEVNNAIIDSTVNLTARRENIKNALLDLEYKKIDLELARFEAGAAQRKARMEYEKAQIALEKQRRDYLLEQNRQKYRIRWRSERLEWLKEVITRFETALEATLVTSPGDGIVMLQRDFLGKRLTKDSYVYPWRGQLATLPDMSSVIIKTYIKEIDISKIHISDSVRVTVDAIPGKKLMGNVMKIANMGETRSGFDMNVFEVTVRLRDADEDLKPGMACNTDIVTGKFENELIVPLDAIFKEKQLPFVYVQAAGRITRRPVETGGEDEKNVVILKGLEEGDRVLLYDPNG